MASKPPALQRLWGPAKYIADVAADPGEPAGVLRSEPGPRGPRARPRAAAQAEAGDVSNGRRPPASDGGNGWARRTVRSGSAQAGATDGGYTRPRPTYTLNR